MIDLNSGSGYAYGGVPARMATAAFVNGLVDRALEGERAAAGCRDYLGASRVGEPCARRLCYEVAGTPEDDGARPGGRLLRTFEAGHVFEDLSIRWLRAAGFDLRTRKRNGEQFGFSTADGRIRGHIDGVIVNGPDLGLPWPLLWEHKSASAKSWTDFVKHGVKVWRPLYYAQVQLYMAYMELEHCLFTAVNKDTLELHHELIAFDPAAAQALSDRAVAVIRSVEARELLPRIADDPDHHCCRFCPYRVRCHHLDGGVA